MDERKTRRLREMPDAATNVEGNAPSSVGETAFYKEGYFCKTQPLRKLTFYDNKCTFAASALRFGYELSNFADKQNMLFHCVLCHDENDPREDKNNACLCRQHQF